MIQKFLIEPDRPLLGALLAHLWDNAVDEVPDLSQTVLLLPTRNVGRQVREALARRAAEQGRAVLSPVVLTPGSLFAALTSTGTTLSPPELVLAAARAIQSQDKESLQAAFGRAETGSMEETLALGRFFLETRGILAENLLDYGRVSQHPEAGDRDRWRALSRVEEAYRKVLHSQDCEDPDDRAARIADDPAPFFRGSRLIVAGTPDFPERVAVCLRKLGAVHPVEILIASGGAPAEAFDEVGRPVSEWFESAPIVLPDSALHVSRDAHEANEQVADRLSTYPDSRSACVCGVGLPATGSALAFELQSRNIPAHDPAGTGFSETDPGRFFRYFCGICFGEEISDLIAWFRDPFVAQWMKNTAPEEQREDWIRESDEWMEEILPNSIADFLSTVRGRPTRSRLFAMTASLRHRARDTGEFFSLVEDKTLRPLLATVESAEGIGEFADALAAIRIAAEDHFGANALKEISRWAVQQSMRFPLYGDRPADAVDVLGWLELLWDDRPWLQIPDFYDGAIPGTLGSHPLLPESLRERLGIPGRRHRDGRDAYILRALALFRQENGRLDLHIPRKDLAGSTVSPSRLLYFTPEENLPARVQLLSREPPTAPRSESAGPLRMTPGSEPVLQQWLASLDRIHVTSFASWIRCPFTFFLERVAGLKTIDSEKLEMDPRLFGTGIHEVLRQLDGEGGEDLDWRNREQVEERAQSILTRWFHRQFGRRPGLLLELQHEGLSRRVDAAVDIRATARAEGWRPLHVEWNFREEELLTLEGIPLSGQIDLVEERGEELRIVDYKTRDKAEGPEEAHLVDLSRRRNFGPSHLLPVEPLPGLGWANLQLPLYAAALRRKYPERPIRIAYGVLPRAVTESRLIEWEGFSDDLAESAFAAAHRVVELWGQRAFWPPTRKFEQSDLFDWSGPDGVGSWLPGDLEDIESFAAAEEGA